MEGFGTPSGHETDPYSVYRDGSKPLTANWDVGAFNITAQEILAQLSCTNLYNGSDGDFCVDADSENASWNETGASALFQEDIGSDCGAGDFVKGVDDDGTLDCDTPAGGGGTGAPHWVDGGAYLYPNTSYADNVLITGEFNLTDWSNATITESQITDLAHIDARWTGNATAALNQTADDVECADCVGDDDVVDTLTASNYIPTSSEGDLNVNSSDNWDDLDSINATQLENDGGILTIIEAWLTGYIEAIVEAYGYITEETLWIGNATDALNQTADDVECTACVEAGDTELLKDIVAGDGLGGGADNVLVGTDADVTLTFDCSDVDGDGLDCNGEDLIFDCSDVDGDGIGCSGEDLIFDCSASIDGTGSGLECSGENILTNSTWKENQDANTFNLTNIDCTHYVSGGMICSG